MTQTSPTRDGLADLLRRRIVVAPMAGGPTATDLVIAAARAGALGFLAAGYKTPGAMAGEITAVRAATAEPFGVNVFVPGARPAGTRSGCRCGPVRATAWRPNCPPPRSSSGCAADPHRTSHRRAYGAAARS
jgi:NAD(P)H-dependent flavin oxidoreductase YrpB (nitropropane dioxygenase family)